VLTVNNLIGFGAGGGGGGGGPIEFVGGAVANKGGATSGDTTIALNSGLTGGVSSAVAAGDFVIAVFATGSTADRTLSISTGYTLLGSELYDNATYDTNLRAAYKFMGGTPDTSVTFGPTGDGADAGAMAVYVFRNVNTTTPLDVAVQTLLKTDDIGPDPPAITPVTAGAFIVCIGAGASNTDDATLSSPGLSDFLWTNGVDTNCIYLGICHKDDWVSGSFDCPEITCTEVLSSWAAMSIALRPA
jgi:hypothetical protein